jgi:hypothetical protein
MATGQIVAQVLRANPPATLYATPDSRAGGSTPAENVPVWDFDDTTAEFMDFLCYLSASYAGGGLTIVLPWSATSATTGDVLWQAAIRRVADDAEDVDTAHTYDYNSASADTAPSASGEISYPTIAFTSGADMDSLAAGEVFILRVKRLPTDAADTMAGDAELWLPIVKET